MTGPSVRDWRTASSRSSSPSPVVVLRVPEAQRFRLFVRRGVRVVVDLLRLLLAREGVVGVELVQVALEAVRVVPVRVALVCLVPPELAELLRVEVVGVRALPVLVAVVLVAIVVLGLAVPVVADPRLLTEAPAARLVALVVQGR